MFRGPSASVGKGVWQKRTMLLIFGFERQKYADAGSEK